MNLRKQLTAMALVVGCASASAAPAASFVINDNTFTNVFSITNLSTTESITGLTITLAQGFVFNTLQAPGNSAAGFDASPDSSGFLATVPSQTALDQSNTLSLTFQNFVGTSDRSGLCGLVGTACTFSWLIDVDPSAGGTASNGDLQVTGNMLAGSSISVSFSTGLKVEGTFGRDANQPLASVWSYASGSSTVSPPTTTPTNDTPEPASLALAGLALLGLGAARRFKRA